MSARILNHYEHFESLYLEYRDKSKSDSKMIAFLSNFSSLIF